MPRKGEAVTLYDAVAAALPLFCQAFCPSRWHCTAPFHITICRGWWDQQSWLTIVSSLQAQTNIGHQELSKLMGQPRLGLEEIFERVQAGEDSRALHGAVG